MAEATKPKFYNVTLQGSARGPRGFYEAGKGRPTFLAPGESRVLQLEQAEVNNNQVRVDAGEVTITAARKAGEDQDEGGEERPGADAPANQQLAPHVHPNTADQRAGNLAAPAAPAPPPRPDAGGGDVDEFSGVDISTLQDDQLRAFVTSLQDGKEPPANTKRETLENKARTLMEAAKAKEPAETV